MTTRTQRIKQRIVGNNGIFGDEEIFHLLPIRTT
jgi:hypothetical protein